MAIESTVNPGGGAAASVRTAVGTTASAGPDPAAPAAQAAPARGLAFRRLFTAPGVDPFDAVEWELRDAVIGNERGEKVFEQKAVEGLDLRRGHRAGELELLGGRGGQDQVVLGVAAVVRLRVPRGGQQRRGVQEHLVQTVAEDVAAAELEQVLRRGVGVVDRAAVIEQQHRGGERVQSGRGERLHGEVLSPPPPGAHAALSAGW